MRRMFSLHLLGHGLAPVVRIDAHDRHAEAREGAVDDLLEDGALVLEVQIERAARDPGGGDDVVDLRRVVAALARTRRARGSGFAGGARPCPWPHGASITSSHEPTTRCHIGVSRELTE